VAIAEVLADRVRLNTAVRSIQHRVTSVTVGTDAGEIAADRVIVAMMPSDAHRIAFVPPLPAHESALRAAWTGTGALKATARYASPFWRQDGLSGTGILDSNAVGYVTDITPPQSTEGWLAIFGDGLEPDGAEQVIIDALEEVFGRQARSPLAVHVHSWDRDPWISACVSALPPGVISRWGQTLRRPVGRVHWAGTETSELWTGYMDGAVRSGQRAAQEVLHALRTPPR
jgi:monoamine oxidase